jgi:hypothetical protein
MPRLKQPKPASHVADAQALIDAVIVIRGDGSNAQDAAEANALLALAAVVDANPANIGALRELRITLDGFRKDAVRRDPQEDLELAELVANLSGPPPDAWQRAYDAAVAAGVPPDAAGKVASAATDNNYDPNPPQTPEEWHARKREIDEAHARWRATGRYQRKA